MPRAKKGRPKKRPVAEIAAGDTFRSSLRPDHWDGHYPMWHGWAINGTGRCAQGPESRRGRTPPKEQA